jgi:hypothetical protein
MNWERDTIHVGTRITGLSETPAGDLQIDMENFETLILTPEDLEAWLRLNRDLATL